MDFCERDATLPTERATPLEPDHLREDLLHQMLPFLLEIAEGGGDEEAEFGHDVERG